MRPLKLVMNAFGPYAGREEVDFSKLNGRNLFLITGPTGAGKTTVFDGISYAIFGRASSEDRDGESLRSQFATLDVLTYVELEFELKGVKYYIKRIPKQEKKKQRGKGTVLQSSDAEMKIYKEDDYKVISGVSNVNEQVTNIMGINYEQFKQIMMIPQGEFRQLITSDSKEREKILQKLFGTEAYKMVENRLFDMQRELEKDIEGIRNKRNESINSIKCGENQQLIDLVNSENKNIETIIQCLNEHIDELNEDKKKIEQAKEKENGHLEELQKRIIEADDMNKKLQEKTKLLNYKDKLLENEEVIKEKQETLNLGRKALQIKGIEENYLERLNNLKVKGVYLSDKEKEKIEKKEALNKLEESLNEERSKEEEKLKLSERITLLKSYIEKAKSYEEKKIGLKLKKENLEKTKENKIKKEKDIEALKKDIEEETLKLNQITKASAEYVKMKAELDKIEMFHSKMLILRDENLKLIKFREEYKVGAKKLNALNVSFETAKLEYDNSFNLFTKGQAALLAKGLEDGKPCPVCGSVHHPTVVKLEGNVPTEDAINLLEDKKKKAEQDLKKADESFMHIKSNGKAQNEIVERLKNEFVYLGEKEIKDLNKELLTEFVEKRLIKIGEEKNYIHNRVLRLEKEKSIEKFLEKNLEEKKKLLSGEEEEIRKLDKKYILEFGEFEKENGLLAELEREIPENLRNFENLKLEIHKTQLIYDYMVKRLKDLEDKFNALKLMHQKIVTEKDEALKNLKEAEQFLKDGETKLKEAVKNAGFEDIECYNAAKLEESKIDKLDVEIKEFNEELRSVKDRLDKILQETKHIQQVDLFQLKEEYEGLKSKIDKIDEEIKEKHAIIQINKNALDRIKELNSKIENKEKKYEVIGDLSYTARGFNEEKLTFERYVLAAFFDEIIEAANLRMKKMTERYVLNRIEEKSKGKAQSGLELQVYDNYTGKFRHVKTLSGGESFKASLALALGLADVVQSYAGGISIDTMFVDEGFGTLDPESLDSAVQCLIELQNSGRLVGIISHVPELKERIDASLEIIPGPEGSITRFN